MVAVQLRSKSKLLESDRAAQSENDVALTREHNQTDATQHDTEQKRTARHLMREESGVQLTVLLEEIEDLRQAGVLVHCHHAVRKNPYPELRNGIIEETSLLPKLRDEELHVRDQTRPHQSSIVRTTGGDKRRIKA